MIKVKNIVSFKTKFNPNYRLGKVVEIYQILDSVNPDAINEKIYMIDDYDAATQCARVYEEDIEQVYIGIDWAKETIK